MSGGVSQFCVWAHFNLTHLPLTIGKTCFGIPFIANSHTFFTHPLTHSLTHTVSLTHLRTRTHPPTESPVPTNHTRSLTRTHPPTHAPSRSVRAFASVVPGWDHRHRSGRARALALGSAPATAADGGGQASWACAYELDSTRIVK